jgi:hypothetical protein
MALTTTDPLPVGVSSNTLTSTGQSKYYVVIITSTRWGTVQAWLPDSIQMLVKSSWGPIVGNIESAMANWFGVPGSPGTTFFSRKLTAQEWRGMEPFQLILPLHFFATEDANEEVIEPIKRLLKMSLPMQVGTDSKLFNLRAPGPVPAGSSIPLLPGGRGREFQDVINVYLGNFLALKEVFIADIPGVQFSAKLSKDGLPMEGSCTVVFKTVYSPTAQEMDTFFGSIAGGPGGIPRPDLG